MIVVNRRTFNIKGGRMREAVAAVKARPAQFTSYMSPLRIYVAETAPPRLHTSSRAISKRQGVRLDYSILAGKTTGHLALASL